MSRTFTPLTGTGAGNAYQTGDKWGYQSAEKLRQALDLLAYCGFAPDLGGDTVGIVTGAATWVAINAQRKLTLNGDDFQGLTLDVIFYYFTNNAATAVQMRLRNVTDSTNAALGSASTSTTLVREVKSVTLASGDKDYACEILGDATNDVAGYAHLRFRTVPV